MWTSNWFTEDVRNDRDVMKQGAPEPEQAAKRSRASVGDNEKDFVLTCYNLASGKGWESVLQIAKQRVLEYGLPERVVQIYTETSDQTVIARMKSVVKRGLAVPQRSSSSTSRPIQVESNATKDEVLMRYANKITPTQRKLENKLVVAFTASPSESEDDDREQTEKKKKKKTDKEVSREAQEAHKQMCSKAMETLEKVSSLLTKVESQLDKSKP